MTTQTQTRESRRSLGIPDEVETLVLRDNAQASREWVRDHPNADELAGLSEKAISEFESRVEEWLDGRDAAVVQEHLGLDVVHLSAWEVDQWFSANGARRQWAVRWDHTEALADWVMEALAHTPDSTYPELG